MDFQKYTWPEKIGYPVEREKEIKSSEKWAVSDDIISEIKEKGVEEVESGLLQFQDGYILDRAMGEVLIKRVKEVVGHFPEVERHVSGSILPTPVRYNNFFQATDYDAKSYMEERINVCPGRKKYFDMILEQRGLSPERVEDLPNLLYHSANAVLAGNSTVRGETVDQLKILQETGLLGSDSSEIKFYMSSSRYLALSHGTISEGDRKAHDQLFAEGCENARKVMLVTIDPKILAAHRDVYIDEESLEWDNEFKKDFVVIAGLPGEAIIKIEIFDQFEVKKA